MEFKIIILLSLILIPSLFANVAAFIEFKDVSNSTGLGHVGKSWGSNWGDFNADNWPDLWKSSHGTSPQLYINNQNGTFTDIAKSLGIDILMKNKDLHGASWADFDNDGDQDLIALTGAGRGLGKDPNFFLVNENGSFYNKALEFHLDNPFGRGRTPLWLDANNDGLLDLFFANSPRPDGRAPSSLFLQEKDRFIDTVSRNQFDIKKYVNAGQISDLTRDGKLDLVLLTSETQGVFTIENTTFSNVLNQIGIGNFWSRDMTISDFNGDLEPDIIFSGLKNTSTDVVLDGQKIKSHLSTENEKTSFSFSATDKLTFDVYPYVPKDMKIFIGSNGYISETNNFSLSPNDPTNWGTISSPSNTGLYVGYKTDQKIWEVTHYSKNSSDINLVITSKDKITNLDFPNKSVYVCLCVYMSVYVSVVHSRILCYTHTHTHTHIYFLH